MARVQQSERQKEILDDFNADDDDEDSVQMTEEKDKGVVVKLEEEKKKEIKDEEDTQDEKLAGGEEAEEDAEEREKIRQQRREKRHHRKEVRDRNYRELHFLRNRNEQLEKRLNVVEKRTTSTEVASIDTQLRTIEDQISQADQVIAATITSDKETRGQDFAEANRIRDTLKESRTKLMEAKSSVEMRSKVQPSEQEVDPEIVSMAQDWANKNSWYDPNKRDADSALVSKIDNSLANEGFDPRTPEYWDELNARIARRMPHRAKSIKAVDADDEEDDLTEEEEEKSKKPTKPNGGGPKFSSRGQERPLRKNEIHVSAERKQALIDLGVWEDVPLRNKYLKRYQEWDKDNASQSRN